jgi:hypothetical protein
MLVQTPKNKNGTNVLRVNGYLKKKNNISEDLLGFNSM